MLSEDRPLSTDWYDRVEQYHPEFNGPLTDLQDALLAHLEEEPDGLPTWDISAYMEDFCKEGQAGSYEGYVPCIDWTPEGLSAALHRMAKRGLVRKEKRGGNVYWHALVYV